MSDFLPAPDDLGEPLMSEEHFSLGARLGAQAMDALDPKNSASSMWLVRRAREAAAGGNTLGLGAGGDLDAYSIEPLESRQAVFDAQRAAIPDTAIADAKARVKQEGLEGHLKLPEQPSIKSPVLDLMIGEAHERRDREAAIARGPQGFIPGALGLVTSLGAGMIDPVNIAAFSIPVLGEARWGKLMASAGDSILARGGVRALQGGAQGAVGTAVLQPADWWLHSQDGQDYTFADALKSVAMGAGMGAGFHAGFGGIGDLYRRARGRPLAGSPEDLMLQGLTGARQAPDAADGLANPDQAVIAEPPPGVGRTTVDINGERTVIDTDLGGAPAPVTGETFPGDVPLHPAADVLADLPPAAREDAFRATVADIAADRPARGGDVLAIAAEHDPRIAESLDLADRHARALSSAATEWPEPPQGARIVSHGDHGPELAGLEGRWNEAVDWLSHAQSGDARGVLEHPDVPGPIDVIWGTKAYGLEHIVQKHPEVVPDLPERLARMRVVDRHSDRIQLESPDGNERAAIALTFHGDKKTWLLTAFDRRAGDGGEPPAPGGSGDQPGFRPTADLQQPLSRYYGGEGAEPAANIRPTADAGNVRDPDLVTKSKPRGRAAAHPDTLSLNEHLASQGGLRPDPELRAIYGGDRGPFIPGFGPLVRKSGMTLDEALSSAKQHGYMLDPHDIDNGTAGAGGRTSHGLTPNDLLDKLDAENRGSRQYKPSHVEKTKYDPEQEKHVIMGALESELEAAGENVAAIDPKLLDRAVEIVHREGVSDVMDAYERAIMEGEERYNAVADERQADPVARDIPGFDNVDDGRAAPGDGGRDQTGDRQAGGPEPGRGRADDPQPSSHGARAAQAAADPRWRELADAPPAHSTPEAIADSQAADAVAEPASVTPKAVSAIEQAADEAEQAWRKVEASYTTEERARIDDALAKLDADRKAREQLISDGAACLAARVLE